MSLNSRLENLERLMSSDDLHNLLTTNTPPSEAQIIYIRGTCLPEIDASLSWAKVKTSTEIKEAEHTLSAPNDYQRYFTNARSQFEGILSHIRTLPSELLGEIFLHFVALTFHFPEQFKRRGGLCHGTPTLSQVCARWRAVTLGDGALWATVQMDLPEWFNSATSLRKRLVQTLQRSGTHPLQIKVAVNKHWLRNEPQTCHHLLAPLFEQVHRWQTVEMYLPYMEELGPLFYTGSGEAPLLETLDLSFHYNARNDPVVIFRNSPRLRTLTAGGGKCILDIPWEQLGTLTLRQLRDHAAMKEYLDVLGRCKSLSLRRLTVEDQYYFRPEYGPMPPADAILQCPDLIYLNCKVPYLTKHLLVAPLLETAVIDNGCDVPDDFRCFVPLLERSNCYSTLTRLRYSKFQFADRADQFEILGALHQLDNLESLMFESRFNHSKPREETLGELRYDLEVVELLASLGDTEGFLPRLRNFYLQAIGHADKGLFTFFGGEGEMVAAFERRHKRDAPLEAVFITIDDITLNKTFSRSRLARPSQIYSAYLTQDETTRMEALREEGLDLYVHVSDRKTAPLELGRWYETRKRFHLNQYRYS
ncbi:hypothetical protein C8J57DRAFT_1460702 [Mycena rebaudengoi]|nr:hypothetical protein C8J57DRAFT_1460702 [Mycena rebaudengoi]